MTGVGRVVRTGLDAVRSGLASALWLAAVGCALLLAVGALLVALRVDQRTDVVSFVLDGARRLDLGSLKEFTGRDAATKAALVDWGVAAMVYLLVGRLLDRVVRPRRV